MTLITAIYTFILAGKAYFTLTSNTTKQSITYRVAAAKSGGCWFVGALNGPDNWSNYQYIGMIDKAGNFRTTRASELADKHPKVKTFRWFWNGIKSQHTDEQATIPSALEFRHSGRCGRCARHLTTPESVDTGFGPECSKMIGKEWKRSTA